jgi:hypothetical protein
MPKTVLRDDPGSAEPQRQAGPSTTSGTVVARYGDDSISDSTAIPENSLRGLPRLAYLTLNSEQMTSRLCRIIRQTAASLALATLPLVALGYIVTTNAPTEWKYVLSVGSTLLIGLGSAFAGRFWKRHSINKSTSPTRDVDRG